MKKIRIGLLSIFILFSSLSLSMACEFLKEQIGIPVSNIIDKYEYLDEPSDDNDPKILTYSKIYTSDTLCKNSQLENTFINVLLEKVKLLE